MRERRDRPEAPEVTDTVPGEKLALHPAGHAQFAIIPYAVRAARGRRRPDAESENRALHSLAECLTLDRAAVLDRLLKLAVDLCGGGEKSCTAGVSLLEKNRDGSEHFHWVAIAGVLSEHAGRTMPRDFSPSGECLNNGETVLFARPELKFTYLQTAGIEFTEALVVPFAASAGGPPLGTLWVVSHPPARHLFDDEDERLLKNLAAFAARAYVVAPKPTGSELVIAEMRLPTPRTRLRSIVKVIRELPSMAGLITIVASGLILLGWALNNFNLKTLFLSNVTIKPNTALALICCASAMVLLAPSHRDDRIRLNVGTLFALVALLIGGLTGLEYVSDVSLGVDRLLFATEVALKDTVPLLRMAMVSAACFVLASTGLLIVRFSRKLAWLSNTLFSINAAISLASILWYAYGAIPLTGTGQGIQIAIPTALMIFLLSVGGILLNPESKLIRTFLSHRAGGTLAVKLLPFVFVVPFALGGFRVMIGTLHNDSMEAAITATLTMFVFAALVWWSAEEMNDIDERKAEADQQREKLLLEAEAEKARAEAEARSRRATQAAYAKLEETIRLKQSSDAFLSSALGSSPMGIVFFDESLRVMRVNSVAARWGTHKTRRIHWKGANGDEPKIRGRASPNPPARKVHWRSAEQRGIQASGH